MKSKTVYPLLAIAIATMSLALSSELYAQGGATNELDPVMADWSKRRNNCPIIKYDITSKIEMRVGSGELPVSVASIPMVKSEESISITLDFNRGVFRKTLTRQEFEQDRKIERGITGVATFDGTKAVGLFSKLQKKEKIEYVEIAGDLKQYQLDDFFPPILIDSGRIPVRPQQELHYGDYNAYNPVEYADTMIVDRKSIRTPSSLSLRCAKKSVNDGTGTVEQVIVCNPSRQHCIERVQTFFNASIIRDFQLTYSKSESGWHVATSTLTIYRKGVVIQTRKDEIKVSLPDSTPDTTLAPKSGTAASRATFSEPEDPIARAPKLETKLVVSDSGELVPQVTSVSKASYTRMFVLLALFSLLVGIAISQRLRFKRSRID